MQLKPYIQIARPDNWFKNIFMLPGIVLAYFFLPELFAFREIPPLLLAVLSTCLVASSNYVLNEILDARFDRLHPEKQFRPIACGEVSIPAAYAEWLLLGAAGIGLGFLLNLPFGLLSVLLWVAGTLYNVPPVRLKDLPYADVISESVNNPIRMALGWYATGANALPPVSVLLSYWMFGAFLMAVKRYGEYRRIGDAARAGAYRSSFRYYNEERLIESLFFYGSLFGMFSGFFMARYHVELILGTPLVAYAIAYYMHLGFKTDSPVQYPERLHRQRKLLLIVTGTFLVCASLLFVRIESFRRLFHPTPVHILQPQGETLEIRNPKPGTGVPD